MLMEDGGEIACKWRRCGALLERGEMRVVLEPYGAFK
jgi:hypothetical protein